MAKGIKFPQSNNSLGAPQGQEEEVYPLPIYKSEPTDPNGPYHISCWELSKEELEEVKKTGKIWLHVFGPTTYPICVMGLDPWPEKVEENKEENSG